jgi:hypothetical protein
MATYVSHSKNFASGVSGSVYGGYTFGASNTSSDGTVMVIVIGDNNAYSNTPVSSSGYGLYISRDSGANWELKKVTTDNYSNYAHSGFSMSRDGQYMFCNVVPTPGHKPQYPRAFYSRDKGVNWSETATSGSGSQLSTIGRNTGTVIGASVTSDDGSFMAMSTYEQGSNVLSINGGNTWINLGIPNRRHPYLQHVCSTDGLRFFSPIWKDGTKHYAFTLNRNSNWTTFYPFSDFHNGVYVGQKAGTHMCADTGLTRIIVLTTDGGGSAEDWVAIFDGTDPERGDAINTAASWTRYTNFSTTFNTTKDGVTYKPGRYGICGSSTLKYIVMQCSTTKFVFSNDYGASWTAFDLTVPAVQKITSISMTDTGKLTYMKSDYSAVINVKIHQIIPNSIGVVDLLDGGETISSLLADGYSAQALIDGGADPELVAIEVTQIKIHSAFTINEGESNESVFTTDDAVYSPTTFADKLATALGFDITIGVDDNTSDSTPYYRLYLQFANAVTLTNMPKYIFNIPLSDFSVKAGGQVNFRNVNLDADMTIATSYDTTSNSSIITAGNYFINDFISTIETDLNFPLSYDEPNKRIEFVGLAQNISISITSNDTTIFDTSITEITTTDKTLPFITYGQPDPTLQNYIDNGITINELLNVYTVEQMVAGGISLEQLVTAGVPLADLLAESDVTLEQLVTAGAPLADLLALSDVTLEQLVTAGAPLADLLALSDVTLEQLVTAGAPLADLLALSDVTLEQLVAIGIPLPDLLELESVSTADLLELESITTFGLIQTLLAAGVFPDWNLDTDANQFDQSYIKSFTDISGYVVIRNDNRLITNGDLSLGGIFTTTPTFVDDDITLKSRLFMGEDISANGNVYIGGDLSVNGQFSGDFADNIIPLSAIISTGADLIDITEDAVFLDDVSFNGPTVDISNILHVNQIEFSDGITMTTHNDNIATPATESTDAIFKESTYASITISSGGVVNADSTSETSDYRIKENVTELSEFDTVDALVPIQYNNIISGKHEFGLLAHELQELYPDLVNGEKDGDEYQHVHYNGLIGILVKEVQELKNRYKLLP